MSTTDVPSESRLFNNDNTSLITNKHLSNAKLLQQLKQVSQTIVQIQNKVEKQFNIQQQQMKSLLDRHFNDQQLQFQQQITELKNVIQKLQTNNINGINNSDCTHKVGNIFRAVNLMSFNDQTMKQKGQNTVDQLQKSKTVEVKQMEPINFEPFSFKPFKFETFKFKTFVKDTNQTTASSSKSKKKKKRKLFNKTSFLLNRNNNSNLISVNQSNNDSEQQSNKENLPSDLSKIKPKLTYSSEAQAIVNSDELPSVMPPLSPENKEQKSINNSIFSNSFQSQTNQAELEEEGTAHLKLIKNYKTRKKKRRINFEDEILQKGEECNK